MNKRMGKPKVPKNRAKGRLLSVRLSESEFKSLEIAAERQGISVSEFTRRTLLIAMLKSTI